MNAVVKESAEKRLFRIHIGLAAFVFFLDQITKFLISSWIEPYGSVYITSFLNLVHIFNKGVAFGMFADSQFDTNTIFLITNAVIVLALIIGVRFLRSQRSQFATAIWLVIGGALGNIADRVVQGHVVDFVDIHFGNWHYATFNVADTAISIGAILIALELFKIQILFRKG